MAASMPAQLNLNPPSPPRPRAKPEVESANTRQSSESKSYSEFEAESSGEVSRVANGPAGERVQQKESADPADRQGAEEAVEIAATGNLLPQSEELVAAAAPAAVTQAGSGQAAVAAAPGAMASAIALELSASSLRSSGARSALNSAAPLVTALSATGQTLSAQLPVTAGGLPQEPGVRAQGATLPAVAQELIAAGRPESAPGNRIAFSTGLANAVSGSGGESGQLSSYALLQTLSDGSTLVRANAPLQQPLQMPAHTNQWGEAIGQRVVWMAGQNLQQANIRVHPQHLGPLEIKLSLSNDQASVTINSPNAAVREAIEASIPRMRELFSQQQMQLVQVDVGQRDSGSQGAFFGWGAESGRQQGQTGLDGAGAGGDGAGISSSPVVRQGVGLLDDYA